MIDVLVKAILLQAGAPSYWPGPVLYIQLPCYSRIHMTRNLKTTGNEEFFLVQLQDFLDGDSLKVSVFEECHEIMNQFSQQTFYIYVSIKRLFSSNVTHL